MRVPRETCYTRKYIGISSGPTVAGLLVKDGNSSHNTAFSVLIEL